MKYIRDYVSHYPPPPIEFFSDNIDRMSIRRYILTKGDSFRQQLIYYEPDYKNFSFRFTRGWYNDYRYTFISPRGHGYTIFYMLTTGGFYRKTPTSIDSIVYAQRHILYACQDRNFSGWMYRYGDMFYVLPGISIIHHRMIIFFSKKI